MSQNITNKIVGILFAAGVGFASFSNAQQPFQRAGALPASVQAPPVATGSSAPASKPLHILFIGNSYIFVNNLPSVVREIAASAGCPLPVTGGNNPGGITLLKHSQRPETLDLIDHAAAGSPEWDVVVLQEQSQTPALAEVSPPARAGFIDGAKTLYRRIKKKNPRARVILYETWARHAEIWQKKPADVASLGGNPAEMQRRNRKWYGAALHELSADGTHSAAIAPVGDVWAKNYQGPHPLRLHGQDGSHPAPGGTYVAGLVLFSTIYGLAPERATYTVPGVSPQEMDALKKLVVDNLPALAGGGAH